MIILLIAGWIACAIFFAGTFVAYFQGEYPSGNDLRTDLGGGLLIGILVGPCAAFVGIFLSGFFKHGWRLR